MLRMSQELTHQIALLLNANTLEFGMQNWPVSQ
jgi:hypothetical protein